MKDKLAQILGACAKEEEVKTAFVVDWNAKGVGPPNERANVSQEQASVIFWGACEKLSEAFQFGKFEYVFLTCEGGLFFTTCLSDSLLFVCLAEENVNLGILLSLLRSYSSQIHELIENGGLGAGALA